MTEYAVLIVGDANRWWTTMDARQRTAGHAEHTRFSEELAKRAHRIAGGAELYATTEARRTLQLGGAELHATTEARRTVQPQDRPA